MPDASQPSDSPSADSSEPKPVYWSRVKEIMDGVLAKWIERAGRQPLPGIHDFYWETSQELKDSVLSGIRAIEPGIPGRETALVRSLARAIGTSGRMPLRGPFLSREETDEIAAWIDSGMPEGP